MVLDKLGSLEYRDAIRKQGSAYSIFAAKAPVEKLAEQLRKLFQVEEWQQNVSRNGKLGDLVGVPVVQFKASIGANTVGGIIKIIKKQLL
ncbi:hypothetical protein RIVM261_002760 [Rivularia sp. IAM M-261]|nr:hypothetical protein CAL7716_055470 [Calothrix sp. PCC 7716]GJD15320.1 hypothetical protein RIVM261_002760 [Rivularia sp. IAM M-261]